MNEHGIVAIGKLGAPPWPTLDPFLFCVHHDDAYPQGNATLGPAAPLTGRRIGMDFAGKDGWRMYHGDVVPGFPRHPHRGFETVTLARRGFIDHADSLGATARFGQGDVQWMTAGRGIVHSEMFPLVNQDQGNPTELFQLWLNLPRRHKMVAPHFTMLWADTIPTLTTVDHAERATQVVLIAGSLEDHLPPAPPPDSWAAQPESHLAIWTVTMAPRAVWTLPAASPDLHRVLYVFRGGGLTIAGQAVPGGSLVQVRSEAALALVNGPETTELLMLQGRPIGEPVAQQGPFVMNSRSELRQAYRDYQRTGFGGWPWPTSGPVHPRGAGRFAVHADGRRDQPPPD